MSFEVQLPQLPLFVISERPWWKDVESDEAIDLIVTEFKNSIIRLTVLEQLREDAAFVFRFIVETILNMITHYRNTGQSPAADRLSSTVHSSKLCLL